MKYLSIILTLLSSSICFAHRDLETGTFLPRDPVGYSDGPSAYCYVNCNPTCAVYEAYETRPVEWSDGTTGNPDPQRANTKDEEAELRLLNEGMRYRDLETGTFLTRDPIRYADGPNLYCYVHCNPSTSFDPLGLDNLFFSDADLSMQSIQNAAPPGIYMSVDGYSDSIGIYNPGQSFLARASAPVEASAEVLDAVRPHPLGDAMMANDLWKQGGWKNRVIASILIVGVVTDVADVLSPWPDAIDAVQKGVREVAEASVEKGAKEIAEESAETVVKKTVLGDGADVAPFRGSPQHTPDQSALNKLAKESKRKGVTDEEADTLLDWAEEYDVEPALDHRGTDHWVGGDHIWIGQQNHIPVTGSE